MRIKASQLMPEIRSAKQAFGESKALENVWSKESLLTQRILIYIASLLEHSQKPKRKPTKWQQFLGRELKRGATLNQAALMWKARKT